MYALMINNIFDIFYQNDTVSNFYPETEPN